MSHILCELNINFTLRHRLKGKNINNDVFVKGVTYGGEDDFYDVVTHISTSCYTITWTQKIKLFYFIVISIIHLIEAQK